MIVHDNIDDCLDVVESNMSILVHGAMATPHLLLNALEKRSDNLENIEMLHLHTIGESFYSKKEYFDRFRTTNFFVGSNTRRGFDFDNNDYIPCFLSEIPYLIKNESKKIDVTFVQVSPPNEHGYCSLGTSVDIMVAAIKASKFVIALINDQVPCVHGDGIIHTSEIDHAFICSEPLSYVDKHDISEEEKNIGQFCAGLISDGACLQMGIGAIPDAVLSCLHDHRDLGIHTEMFSDMAVDLIKAGVVTNSKKKVHAGKTISSFVMGTKDVTDFINNNPSVNLLTADYVNNPYNIARNDNVVAINSAIEVDLTGQVCADSIGHRMYSGVGGQMDFIRGASMSRNGRPIIALTSRTKKGKSKISATLAPGAGVVTTRAHVHYVITEYGIANLYGKTLGQRAKELINIAHPDDRESIERDWFEAIKKFK